jgi:hypothetical protein
MRTADCAVPWPVGRLVAVSAALTALAALIALIALGFGAGPTAAQSDAVDDVATVEFDVLGTVDWNSGRRVEARVTVETARAVSGTLSVVDEPAGGATTTFEFDVDLAAGTTAVFPVTLTTGWEGISGSASLRSGGEVVATDDVSQFPDQQGHGGIVATLGIADPPRAINQRDGDGGGAQMTTLPVDASLRGLSGASTLVTTPAEVRALGAVDADMQTVQAWVRGGGQLLIDGPPRSLDDSYHLFPTANPNRFAYGAGSILYDTDWRDGVPIGGYLGQEKLSQLVESQNLGSGAAGELAALANVALPAVLVIVAALMLYSLLAGPLVFGFLSARRAQSRIWVVLPALSLLFAAGIVAYGFASRTGRSDAHITIVEVAEEGSRATTNLMLTSNLGTSRTIDAPAGWVYLGQGRVEGQRPVLVRDGATSTELAIDMLPGSNAVTRFSGVATSYDGLLVIDNIRLDGDQLTAEVTNRGPHDLQEAVAMLGNARSEVGTIAAGESTTVSVDVTINNRRVMSELLLWPRVDVRWGERGQIAVPRERDAVTAAGAWTEWRIEQGASVSPQNLLSVVGWADGYASPIEDVADGRTALVARANIGSVGSPTGWATSSFLPSQQQARGFDEFFGVVEEYRVTLDPDTGLDDVAIEVSANSSAVSVLVGDEWSWIDIPNDGRVTVGLPPEASTDGEIRLRSYVPEWVWAESATVRAVPAASADADGVATLGDEPNFRQNGFEDREFIEEQMAMEAGPGLSWNLEQEDSSDITEALADEAEFVVENTMSSGTYHAFVVELEEGQGLNVALRSGERDPFLELVDPAGELISSDDDSGSGLNSSLSWVARESGTYEIRAMELSQRDMNFELTVEVER